MPGLANHIPTTVNPELQYERDQAEFEPHDLSMYMYGAEHLERREYIADLVDRNPEFNDPKPIEFMTREERYANASRKIVAMVHNIEEEFSLDQVNDLAYYEGLIMAGESHPFGLHFVMFLPSIQNQASDEQQEKWLPLALSRAITGTYAQTEMGHGTNLGMLETTATYDEQSEEFVIHTPTLTATKWWPGNLGKTANYAVVMAQLWTKGVNHGPHPFIVQLRDHKTHMPVNGIKVGDIGPKFGMESNDNGFLQFDHVRIPRDQMLMRNAQVKPDGTYLPPAHKKLSFGTMIYVRSIMLRQMAAVLGKATCIATRYSSIRRQGRIGQSEGEVKLLDYQTQQFRIIPYIAKSYAFFVAANHMMDVYNEQMRQIHRGNTDGLAELHALASGLKAHITWTIAQGIEQCRLSCGGHGYMKASGLPELYALYVGGCTYEGDNIVLLLQTSRYLMKAARAAREGNRSALSSTTSYLLNKDSRHARVDKTLRPSHLVQVLEHIARRQTMECLEALDALQASGLSVDMARNKLGVQMCTASRSHTLVFLAQGFAEWTNGAPEKGEIRRVLMQLSQLFLTNTIIDKAGYAMEDGYLSKQQLEMIRHEHFELIGALRKNAVALVDSWAFRDRELRSVLGRYDGRVYENLMEWAQHSTLNKKEVMDCHFQYLGPMMDEARSKL